MSVQVLAVVKNAVQVLPSISASTLQCYVCVEIPVKCVFHAAAGLSDKIK